MTATYSSGMVCVEDLAQAWRSVCQAHPILRTVFTSGLDDVTAFQQIVLRETEPTIGQKVLEADLNISSFLKALPRPSIPQTAPPHVLTIVHSAVDSSTFVVFDIDHVIVDARTMHIISQHFTSAYQRPSQIPRGASFSDYISWTQG